MLSDELKKYIFTIFQFYLNQRLKLLCESAEIYLDGKIYSNISPKALRALVEEAVSHAIKEQE